MPITPERLARLREFGLSEYAARAYLALLDLGVAEARDVSTLSKVPQAKIYHVLEQLHEKGLAVILPEFPKKYAPVPFPEYLDRLHDQHKREAEAIGRDREVLAEMFRVVGDAEVGNRGFFTVIRGRRNVLAKIAEMLDQSKTDFVVLGTEGFSQRYEAQLPGLTAASKRGVRLRALIPLTPATIPRLDALDAISEIRARDVDGNPNSSRVAIVLADSTRAFLINFLPDDDNVYSGKDIGVFTDHEAMVAAIHSLIEPRWVAAPTLAARRDEVATGRLPEATSVYATREDAAEAIRAAFARDPADLRVIDPVATRALDTARELASFGEAGADARAILHVPTHAAAAETLRILLPSGVEARHLSPRVTSGFWCFGHREAFVALPSEDALGAVVIHTNSPGVLRSLVEQFEQAWTRALPLDQRARELKVFPGIQPRDLGIGRLFDEVHEAVVVTDAEGHVVLWNPGAVALFSRPVDEALGVRIDEIVPGSLETFLDAAGGTRLDLVPLKAAPRDGERVDIEARLVPIEATGGLHYAMALLAPASRDAKRVDVIGETAQSPTKAPRK